VSIADRTQSDSDAHRVTHRRPQPVLVAAFSCQRPLEPPSVLDLARHQLVALGRSPPAAGVLGTPLAVPDDHMSALHARFERVVDRWVVEDAGSKNGVRVNGVVQRRAALSPGDVVECGQTFLVYEEFAEEGLAALPADAPSATSLHPGLRAGYAALARVAPSRVAVLLYGETGTGKELAARALHTWSGRSGSFIAVNCGALPPTLVESELFGVKRGAYTGASEDRPGLLRAATDGTLLLDEVGELPLAAQVSLLRVLQEGELVPVGGSQPVRVDLRVVAATHRDLAEMVQAGTFRADLYARLSGLSVELPPLQKRRVDLGLLVGELLRRLGGAETLTFSREAGRALFRYPWPLNVRELEKALELALALADTGRIELEHLPPAVRAALDVASPQPPVEAPLARPLSSADLARRAELLAFLRTHRGNVSAVARELRVARMQVQRWCKRFHLDPASFRSV
jgi:DNA-binding NtrC family response regulator